ncbi:MAG: rhamnulokinase [Pseudobutyrivibrio sp.]|nr:rhamnulokinase [Pseudobutyrivibrio sp.]MBD8916471.1 rhamnulokinase [Pseudobutyrivibrio sp.]
MQYYLAVDIGASSGRHILSHLENGKIILEEIYRFSNGMVEVDGEKVWDSQKLFEDILTGMKKCYELGKIPVSMGIDTWAVDFALLDKEDNLIGKTVGYRDGRTKGMDQEVYKVISQDELYERTGIQKQIFNTIYQLMAVKMKKPQELADAKTMLLIPDYFNFLLTGRKVTEYTNASTTQLLHPETKEWDFELIDMLGFPRDIFTEIKLPGTIVGELTEEIQKKVGFCCKVVLPATHDTGSAVVAVPSNEEDVLYISSGTWSLMGTELKEAICTKESMEKNLTNEGGYDYRFRYLKNIMGMWMINSAKKEIADDMSYADICAMASKTTIASIVPANDDRFLAPKNMTEEVKAACRESGQQVPEGIAEVAAVIYHSLAKCYADTMNEIEEITGKKYDCIHIVGGGSNAVYLNELTAKACGKTVYTGPTEATAVGNVAAQMIAAGELADLKSARECIFHSFKINKYEF